MQHSSGGGLIEQMQQALQLLAIAKEQLSGDLTIAEFESCDTLNFIDSFLIRFCNPLDQDTAEALFDELKNNQIFLVEAFNKVQDRMQEDGEINGVLGTHELQVDPGGSYAKLVDASTSPEDRALIEKLTVPFQMATSNPELLQPILEKSSNLFTKVYLSGGDARASRNGKAGARARLERDAKTQEKEFIKMKWKEWQRGESHYKTQEAFADAMDILCLNLECNHSTINGWIRAWKKALG